MHIVYSKMKDAEGIVHETTLNFEDGDFAKELYESLYHSANVSEARVMISTEWMSFKRGPVNEGFKPASGNFYL